MYIQNLVHTRPSINRSCSCQQYLSLVHICVFSDPQIIAPSHKAQHYIKALLNSQKWANLRETAERNSATFKVSAHPNPHQKPRQTAPRMSRKEARRQNPASLWCCCPRAGSLLPHADFYGASHAPPCHSPKDHSEDKSVPW